ncbi:hypothetical protein C0995_003049 [Termitomyces sp. Mi166|nr:hypothetical protein C0995_003049 [Termitomyces sp. Mi166\
MSFAFSSSTSVEYDTTPGSSTSTVPGPGALTGKAIKALGVATLKGFGRLVMAGRWVAIVHTFPHTDEQAQRIRHIDEIYDDLLEFSRPGIYSHDVNAKAMGLILAQIGADVANEEEYHIYIACNASLLDVTGYEESRMFVASHPIASLWPIHVVNSKHNLFPFKIRREALLLGPDSDVSFVDHSPFIGISL